LLTEGRARREDRPVEASVSASMAVGSGAVMALAMVPSAVFTLRLQRHLGASSLALAGFATGYLAAWTVVGAAAMLALDGFDHAGGPALTGAAVLGAAAYQGSLARRFLHRCRSPLGLLLLHWRPGMLGATRLGGVYALWCVGCCAGLLTALVLLGFAGAAGMFAMGAVVFAEKRALPGVALSQVVAAALGVCALATVLA
jgi:predicted metal-binding membrane protein